MSETTNPESLRSEFYSYLLEKREPRTTNPDHPLTLVAEMFGPEAVLRTLDAAANLVTPEATQAQLDVFALGQLLRSNEALLRMWVTIG